MLSFSRMVLALTACSLLAPAGLEAQKKKREEVAGMPPVLEESKRKKDKPVKTEILEATKDLPLAVVVDSQKLGFYVSPLSGKGLLSQQVKDGLKSLAGLARGATIVNLRAFVTGTGDLRRVQTIVSETFSDKRLPLPTLTVVQAGALPMEGAQVILEAITIERKVSTPNGVSFLPVQRSSTAEAADRIKSAIGGANASAPDVRRVTCFVDSIENGKPLTAQLVQTFPTAAVAIVQALRDSEGDGTSCEVLVASSQKVSSKLILTGMQQAFGKEDADLKLGLERLEKGLESVGVDWKAVVFARTYSISRPLARKMEELVRAYGPANPASTSVLIESLSSLDATVGLDVVATAN